MCKYFNEHPYFQGNRSLIRLHFYFDELEVCNPLGSSKSKNKLACFYFFVGNIGPNYYSSLRNIFLVLVKTDTLKKHCLSKIVAPLVKDLQKFQTEGISIDNQTCLMGNNNYIFGSIATISADNLGAHYLGGFRRCFSSGRIYRFCMCTYNDLINNCTEAEFMLRTAAAHEFHIQAVSNDESLVPSYRVVKSSHFDVISGFLPVTAFPANIMHDCLEGVLPQFLHSLFRHLQNNRIYSFALINQRLKNFKFGATDKRNKPRPLPGNVILSPGKISLLASETLCLFRNLPFVIGDIVPTSDEAWAMYNLLSDVMDIILAQSVCANDVVKLRALIENFYSHFIKFSPDLVKPKLHFLLHYPRFIEIYGPLRNLWCMHFESFHRKIKIIAHNCQNFKNICLTVAKRIQSLKCYEQCNITCLTDDLCRLKGSPITMDELPVEFAEYLQSDMGISVNANLINVIKLVKNGVTYAVNSIYVLDCVNDKPMFIQVMYIVVCDSNTLICGNLLRPVYFNSHFYSYVIDNTDVLLFFKPGSEKCHHRHDMYNCCGMNMIRLQYKICV